ncbi:helix-turn-helix transcriptional regulator [Streptomyces sp. NPDC006332]|uniref:helix-turn-helix transcriptional regulator n=1 Tax=Streptomyces sp. NPDC006332 TaxID=3155456 RepID=UPI0033B242D0
MARHFSGLQLRAARRRAGLSVHQVAARVGRTCWSVYAYERGAAQPPIEVADALADVVGAPLTALLADDGVKAVAV